MVTYRAKSSASLEKKLRSRDNKKHYKQAQDIYTDIPDLAGVRVALYFPSDKERAGSIIAKNFDVIEIKTFPESSKDMKSSSSIYKKRFSGYDAQHYRVRINRAKLDEHQSKYCSAAIEIQVASVLMHSWSEVEHDLIYKPKEELSIDEHAILDELNGLVMAGEIALERLHRAGEIRFNEIDAPFRSHYDLATFLMKEGSSSFKNLNIGQVDFLFEFLAKIGKNSPRALKEYLTPPLQPGQASLSNSLMERVTKTKPEYMSIFEHLKSKQAIEDSIADHARTKNMEEVFIGNFKKIAKEVSDNQLPDEVFKYVFGGFPMLKKTYDELTSSQNIKNINSLSLLMSHTGAKQTLDEIERFKSQKAA